MWKTICIQDFINKLEEKTIPKAVLVRLKRGYSNKRIIEDFKAVMINIKITWLGKKPLFIVPYCNLALNIGIGHGLCLYDVIYPENGYFSDPENTLDETYQRKLLEKV